ncbi:hypothetical protein [Pseudomonas sp. MYb118]|uniref:hypothetical protein n=1 Tax=Pseudomonas sp. MYb118 TaxID=1848720 RepID=UPI0034CD2BD5
MNETNVQHKYGHDLVEFFKHSDEELQMLTKDKETAYFRHCTSPAYPQLGVNVAWLSEKPLTQALNELAAWLIDGYTVATSVSQPLHLSVNLRKPQKLVDDDLLTIAEQAKVEYAASRYARNFTETRRQMEITIAKRAREAAAEAAKVAAAHQQSEEEFALADLLAAYSPKKSSAAK